MNGQYLSQPRVVVANPEASCESDGRGEFLMASPQTTLYFPCKYQVLFSIPAIAFKQLLSYNM